MRNRPESDENNGRALFVSGDDNFRFIFVNAGMMAMKLDYHYLVITQILPHFLVAAFVVTFATRLNPITPRQRTP